MENKPIRKGSIVVVIEGEQISCTRTMPMRNTTPDFPEMFVHNLCITHDFRKSFEHKKGLIVQNFRGKETFAHTHV